MFGSRARACSCKTVCHGSGASPGSLPSPCARCRAMAGIEAMQELYRMNSDLMLQMKNMQEEAMKAMFAEMQTALANNAQYGGGARGDLRDRLCREMGSFKGEESEWQDWSLKFRAAVKEANLDIFEGLKWAEAEN